MAGGDTGADEEEADEWEAELLADAVHALLSDPFVWEREARGALERVHDHFEHKHLLHDMRALLSALHLA